MSIWWWSGGECRVFLCNHHMALDFLAQGGLYIAKNAKMLARVGHHMLDVVGYECSAYNCSRCSVT